MKWGLVSDCSCNLKTTDIFDQNIGLEIVPLKIMVGSHEFIDDDNVNIDEMLHTMKHTKEGASSSCPSPGDFKEAFMKYDNVIAVTMTGALSGTYNSACLGREMALEECPDKKIFVLDSKSTVGSIILTLQKASDLINSGLDFEEICEKTKDFCRKLHLVITLSCYDNLIKAGRMKSFTGSIASVLGIRAVTVASPEGTLDIFKKPRGEDKAIEAMLDIIGSSDNICEYGVSVCHCKNPEGVKKLIKRMKERFGIEKIKVLECKALASFYAMPGGLVISF